MNGLRVIGAVVALLACAAGAHGAEVLSSWREGAARSAILDFVQRTTDPASPDFVPPLERVAVLDHDGTLWPEQPVSAPLRFAVDRIRAEAPQHPEWYRRDPYRSLLKDDSHLGQLGDRELMQLLLAAHAGLTPEAFAQQVQQWLAGARHPRFGRPYIDLVYQPMRELVQLLEDRGYRVFIHASGGADFLRAFVERVWGLPRERVIGNQVVLELQMRDGRADLVRSARLHWSDQAAGKPATVEHILGRRPVIVVANSDQDEALMNWAAAGRGPRLVLRLLHDDPGRDYESRARRTSPAWQPVSMKNDWLVLFAPP